MPHVAVAGLGGATFIDTFDFRYESWNLSGACDAATQDRLKRVAIVRAMLFIAFDSTLGPTPHFKLSKEPYITSEAVALYVDICPPPDVFVQEWTLWACRGPLCAAILLCFHHLAFLKCGAPVAHDEGMDVAQNEKVALYQGRFVTQVDSEQSFGWVEPRRRYDASRRL